MATAKTLLKAGEYEAVLERVADKVSKQGNPMWVVTWRIPYCDGATLQAGNWTADIRSVKIIDYIVKSKPWKLEQIARAWGKLAEYEDDRFKLLDYLESHITVVLGVEYALGFEQRNFISGYRPPKGE